MCRPPMGTPAIRFEALDVGVAQRHREAQLLVEQLGEAREFLGA